MLFAGAAKFRLQFHKDLFMPAHATACSIRQTDAPNSPVSAMSEGTNSKHTATNRSCFEGFSNEVHCLVAKLPQLIFHA